MTPAATEVTCRFCRELVEPVRVFQEPPAGWTCPACSRFNVGGLPVLAAVAVNGTAPNGVHGAGADSVDSRLPNIENRENRENRETARARGFVLTSLSALLAEEAEAVSWVVDGMLPVGGISLCGAKPKVGKSTTVRYIALRVARGEPALDRATLKGAVVYLALEEKREMVKQHFRRMGATDELIDVHTGSAPEEALEALRATILARRPVLAIVDPVLKLIRLRDANDYAEVSRAFEPLIDLARASGCHILCVHHLGKGDRTGGDAVLGSTALFGAVDTLLLMKRRDRVRTIETVQRYGEDMPETVLALDPETGLLGAAGEVSALQLAEARAAVLAALGDDALTEADVRERVGGNQSLTGKAVRALVEDGGLERGGAGKRGDPYVYRRPGRAAPAEPAPAWAEELLAERDDLGAPR